MFVCLFVCLFVFFVCLFVFCWVFFCCCCCCLMSQQHASVSQGRICSDKFTCCYTEIQVADQTLYLTQSQYTDTGPTGPTSPIAVPIMPGAWQGIHWSANFLSHWYDSIPKKSRRKRDSNPGSSAPEADALITRPARRRSWTKTAHVHMAKKKKKRGKINASPNVHRSCCSINWRVS